MKEHMFLIETHLPCSETAFLVEANVFKKSFEDLLGETVILANGIISEEALNSKEIVTKYTLPAEKITMVLTGANINTNITEAELMLKPNPNYDCTEWLENTICHLNLRSKNLLEEVIKFKEQLLSLVLECRLGLMLYPEMLKHLIEEAKLYLSILNCLLEKSLPESQLCDELNFWNHIMMEHAEFVDGMLDPSEEELKATAEEFVRRFETLLNECTKIPAEKFIKKSMDATMDIRDFKKAATEGLLECEIKSIIPPILADHVLREANHYIRILNNRAD
jgi:hypothetical protein